MAPSLGGSATCTRTNEQDDRHKECGVVGGLWASSKD